LRKRRIQPESPPSASAPSGRHDTLTFDIAQIDGARGLAGRLLRGALEPGAALAVRDHDRQHGARHAGERNRVHLAKVLKSGGNVLLLDEPTNDLDIETLRALEEGLLAYPGRAVVISHDRWFLDRIATHILAFEGNSEVVWFEGNHQEYVEDYRKRRGEDALQPHRIRYKPLVR
jgi:hypothetical protein